MNLNTSCFVMQPEEMLPDGTPCKTGFCNKGVCEPTMTDIVIRIWDFFEDFNISSVMRFLKVSIYLAILMFFSTFAQHHWVNCLKMIIRENMLHITWLKTTQRFKDSFALLSD